MIVRDTVWVAVPERDGKGSIDIIVSLLALANLVLLPLLLTPTRAFRAVKWKLNDFKFAPHKRDATGADWKDKEETHAKEVQHLHRLFWRHASAFDEYKAIRMAFLLVMVVPVIAILAYQVESLSPFRFKPSLSALFPLLLVATELVVLHVIHTVLATAPEQLQSIRYLVKKTNLNVHGLIDAMRLNVSFDALTDMPRSGDPLLIRLRTDLLVFGYRFLYVAYDAAGKVYLLSFGPVITSSNQVKFWIPPGGAPFTDEYFGVVLGKMSLRLRESATLKVRLYVFASVYGEEEVSAMYSQGDQEFVGEKSGRIRWGGGGGHSDIQTVFTDREVKYRGEGTLLTDLNATEDADPTIRTVVAVFREGIMRSNRVVTRFDRNGNVLL